MPEFEDTRGGRCKGYQEPNSLFQSEYDGGIGTGLGK